MTFKTLAAAVALTFIPALSFAGGCSFDQQAMSCAEGSVFDAESGTCVPVVSS
jgi:hypothetical protein